MLTREDIEIVREDEAETPITAEHAGDGADDISGQILLLWRSMANDIATLAHLAVRDQEVPEETDHVTLLALPGELALWRKGRKFLAVFTPTMLSNCYANIQGMQYTFNLPAGWTVLNLPDGTLLSAPAGTTAQVLVKRTNNFQGTVL